MELIFNKEPLLRATQIASSIAGSKSTLPIIANVLLRTVNDLAIQISATDLEIGVKHTIEGEIIEPGSTTIPARKLSDIVHELPNTGSIRIRTTANDRIEIECNKVKFRITGLPDEEFPKLPDPRDVELSIRSTTLQQMIEKTIFAASTEETKHFLNGLYFSADSGSVTMVGTDGKRLAMARQQGVTPGVGKIGVIVPTKAVMNIPRMFIGDTNIDIGTFENQVVFTDQNSTLISRLIEGEYPDYMSVINSSIRNDMQVVVETEEMLSAVKRVSLMSNPKTPAIRLDIGTDEINISANTPDLGEAQEQISARTDSMKLEIAFNAKFLIDVLRNIQTKETLIKLRDPLSPTLIMPYIEESKKEEMEFEYMCVVMPMRY